MKCIWAIAVWLISSWKLGSSCKWYIWVCKCIYGHLQFCILLVWVALCICSPAAPVLDILEGRAFSALYAAVWLQPTDVISRGWAHNLIKAPWTLTAWFDYQNKLKLKNCKLDLAEYNISKSSNPTILPYPPLSLEYSKTLRIQTLKQLPNNTPLTSENSQILQFTRYTTTLVPNR